MCCVTCTSVANLIMQVSLSWYAGAAGVEGEGEELVEASGRV